MATVWNAEGVDFDNFNPVSADYGPRDIKAVAAMVNRQNIGQWALEFEKDLSGQHSKDGDPFFEIMAEREGESPIRLTIKPGFWIVKVWNELHVFKEGLFQRTFEVPRDQLVAARKAYRDKEIAEERDYQLQLEEQRSIMEAEFEQKLEDAMESGDWSDLTEGEKAFLQRRLDNDEKFQTYVQAARMMKAAEADARKQYAEQDVKDSENVFRPHVHIPISGLVGEIKQSGVPADYHAGSLYRSEGQEPGFYDKEHPRFLRIRDKASGEVVTSTVEAWEGMLEEARSMFELVEDETQIVPAVGELEENLNRETEEKTE